MSEDKESTARDATDPDQSDECQRCPDKSPDVIADVSAEADGLCAFVDASPSPFHVCATARAALRTAGFVELAERDSWPHEPGRYVVVRDGSLVAWSTEHANGPLTPYRVVGAHTDSPNLRIKPQPDLVRAGWALLGVEVYGGPLLNSWLDRDLGLSGRVAVRSAAGVQERLFRTDEPLLRIPSSRSISTARSTSAASSSTGSST